MKKKLIGWIAAVSVLLAACEQQDETERIVQTTDGFRCTIPLSFASSLQAGNPEYVPMTKADGKVKTIVMSWYKCLILKQVEGGWYIDQIVDAYLDKNSKFGDIKVMSDTLNAKLDVVLRPGVYRAVVVLNPGSLTWNEQLTPGLLVKGENDANRKVPYAFTYGLGDENHPPITDKPVLGREIFTGTLGFEVSKTGDLHSNAINGNKEILLTRKVSRIRICLKKTSPEYEYPFDNTQHFMSFVLKATGETPFCDGIDCWGDPYYDGDHPRWEHQMYVSAQYPLEESNDGGQYLIVKGGATYNLPFVFVDETEKDGIPFQIHSFYITTRSGPPDNYRYYYNDTITGHMLYPNSIDGVVFQATDDVNLQTNETRLEIVPDERPARLFSEFNEWN